MRPIPLAAISLGVIFAGALPAHTPPLLPEPQIAALSNELSGETPKRNLEGLAQLHRQRGSQGLHAAAELIADRARTYGLSHVQILQFPADGQVFYGTQRSRRGWDAQEGELAEVKNGREVQIASFAAEPVVLAEDSESADVTADLIDVGDGTKEADYAGKEVQGKIVLVSASAGAVQDLAIGQMKAAGIVSYAQNQRTAWSGDNDNLVRWGHLESFSAHPTFAFMVSLKTARTLQERFRQGESIRVHAKVTAGQHAATYEVVTATIEGADPKLEEIAYSCHLDHQRPGANDNASGCVTTLEIARTLQKLINAGKLPRPMRTIRFIWPPEIEGTVTLLNAKPEFAHRIKTAIHMDMVGGGPDTKAVFHVTRGPMSLPSFVQDVAWAFASWANTESYLFAAGSPADYPLTAPEGGKEPLRAEYTAYTMGSDHDVYQDSSFGIPAIYLNDWPDRYIHTNFDSAANIDPTKLKRAAFIGAASGYFLANFAARDVTPTRQAVEMGRLLRAAQILERNSAAAAAPLTTAAARAPAVAPASAGASDRPNPAASKPDSAAPVKFLGEYEHAIVASVEAYLVDSNSVAAQTSRTAGHDGTPVVTRRPEPRGPLAVFGYDYFADHARAAGIATPRLLNFEGAWGSGEEYAYEALNLANGKRTVREITTALSVEYGTISEDLVSEYLHALQRIGVVELRNEP